MAQNHAKTKKTPDYASIRIPDDKTKPRPRWSYLERRAELLRLILEAGTSFGLSRTKMAEMYGKSISTITRDIQAVEYYLADNIDTKKVESMVVSTFQKAVKESLKDQKYGAERAYRLSRDFVEYLQSIGKMQRAAERHEVSLSGPVVVNIVRRKKEDGDNSGEED